MRKLIALAVSLVLACTAACAFAEQTDSFFAQFAGFEWSFCSGVGAWSTDMEIYEDGSFSGQFHDSEMGDAADAYPNGTVYYCSFTGRFSPAEQINDYTWKIRVDELKTAEEPDQEMIDDGFRYISAKPYGISEGDEMLLHRPGTPVDGFTDLMQIFAHLLEQETPAETLDTWFLWSDLNESGFTGILNDSAPAGAQ